MNAARLLPRTYRSMCTSGYFLKDLHSRIHFVLTMKGICSFGEVPKFLKTFKFLNHKKHCNWTRFLKWGKTKQIRPPYKLRCRLTHVSTIVILSRDDRSADNVEVLTTWFGAWIKICCWGVVSALNSRNVVKASSRFTVKLVVVISFRPTPLRPWDLDVSVTISQFIQ